MSTAIDTPNWIEIHRETCNNVPAWQFIYQYIAYVTLSQWDLPPQEMGDRSSDGGMLCCTKWEAVLAALVRQHVRLTTKIRLYCTLVCGTYDA